MSSLHYIGPMTYRLVVSGKTQPGSFTEKNAAMVAAAEKIAQGHVCRIEAHYPSPEIPMVEFSWDSEAKDWVPSTPA